MFLELVMFFGVVILFTFFPFVKSDCLSCLMQYSFLSSVLSVIPSSILSSIILLFLVFSSSSKTYFSSPVSVVFSISQFLVRFFKVLLGSE